jgi:ATP-dependent Clp protease ATP-binding subunit ClpA
LPKKREFYYIGTKGYIGSEDGGALPNAIRKGGRRLVILFDEVEKAHQSIWQKMLAFFDEGRTGDSKGEVTAPKDTILLMTTNRRAEEVANDPAAAREILRHDGYFSAEFMGRVEKVVPMPRLTDTDMMELTHRLSGVLARTYGVSLDVDEDALVALYAESRDGAQRSGGRGITERLKDLLIDDLLELQGDGRAAARIVVSEGRVRAVPA